MARGDGVSVVVFVWWPQRGQGRRVPAEVDESVADGAVPHGVVSQDIFMAGAPMPFGFGLWTSHITPALLGGPKEQMLSYFIAFYTNQTINWGMAAALSAVLLAATLLLYMVYARYLGPTRVKYMKAR